MKTCIWCGKPLKKRYARKFCDKKCMRKDEVRRNRENYTVVCLLGYRQFVYTGKDTAEAKRLLPVMRRKVLDDCVKNPRKYLNKVR